VEIIQTIQEMQKRADVIRLQDKIIGFVPTMGYLHEGHLSLIRMAREKADVLVVSIFVNPTQFGPNEDLDQYPRDFNRDQKLAQEAGADIIFYPSEKEIYPDNYLTYVHVESISKILCGESRPTHFRGVTTVCSILFHAVKPHFAVFGQKDFQQAVIIKKMVRDLHFDLKIYLAPIVREPDGLAMSSRNTYLSAQEREDALSLHQSLVMVEEMIQKGERETSTLISEIQKLIDKKRSTRIDYIQIVDPNTLQPLDKIQNQSVIALAVFVGKTRLIDNVIIKAIDKER